MVGWVRYKAETWESTMHRMKIRVQQASLQHKVRSWSERIKSTKASMVRRIDGLPADRWEVQSSKWLPNKVVDNSQEYYAFRERGRPSLRWCDGVEQPVLAATMRPQVYARPANRVSAFVPFFVPSNDNWW